MYKRYGIEAKRVTDVVWSEWTQTDSKKEAEQHKQHALSLGFKARVIDRQKEAEIASKLQTKIFP